jgi:phospholipid/cholesterol/gamma-HCH transport system substrate-binding protein
MDERVVQFRVGVMVLATLLIAVILVLLFGEGPAVFTPRKTIYVIFPDATGVGKDTPIKKSGILIGRVQKVELLPEGGARVTAGIDSDKMKMIRKNELCVIKSTLLGDSVLHFVPSGRKDLPSDTVEEKATIKGVAYDDPIQVVANLQERLSGAIGSVARTSDELGQVVHQVGDLLKSNEQKINRIITQTDETSGLLRDTVRNANDIFGDPGTRTRIKDSLEDLPKLIQDSRQTMAQVSSMMSTFDRNLHNLEKFTGTLGDQGADAIAQVGRSAQKLDELMAQLLDLTKAMNSKEGSLGQFIHDPELYDNLNRTVRTAEELSRRLRPIVEDVRVFSDQIARHPEKLGVRGAIEKSPGTKW